MKRRQVWTLGVLLAGLLTAPAMAADGGDAAAAPQQDEQALAQDGQQAAPEVGAVVPGTVPQAQIDIFNKREEARKRRDEALKVRQQMMQTGQ